MSIKNIIRIFIGVLFLAVVSDLLTSNKKLKELQNKYEISTNNEKILLNNNDSLKTYSDELQLTVEQLKYSNNVTLDKLNKVKEELNVVNKAEETTND